MYTGFNLKLENTSSFWGDKKEYERLASVGRTHLDEQKVTYLRKYKL